MENKLNLKKSKIYEIPYTKEIQVRMNEVIRDKMLQLCTQLKLQQERDMASNLSRRQIRVAKIVSGKWPV